MKANAPFLSRKQKWVRVRPKTPQRVEQLRKEDEVYKMNLQSFLALEKQEKANSKVENTPLANQEAKYNSFPTRKVTFSNIVTVKLIKYTSQH
jgi:hypothetical protein